MTVTINSGFIAERQFVPAQVEVSIENGVGIHIIGLADSATKESLLRVVTALQALGYSIPGKKVIVNILPSDLRKRGQSCFDLPMAIGILYASEQVMMPKNLGETIVMGELGLDGSVRAVQGGLLLAEYARSNGKECIMPRGSALEVLPFSSDNEYDVYIAKNINEALFLLACDKPWDKEDHSIYTALADKCMDECERGEEQKKIFFEQLTPVEQRAVLIAACGGFDMLLQGEESRNRLVAHALLEILPARGLESVLETAKNYSAMSRCYDAFCDRNPYRDLNRYAASAHFTEELRLAHGGILFIEDPEELPKSQMEVIHAARIDRKLTIARFAAKSDWPSDFQTVFSVGKGADRKKVLEAISKVGTPAVVCLCVDESGSVKGEMKVQKAMGTVLRVRDELNDAYGHAAIARFSAKDAASVWGPFTKEAMEMEETLAERLGLRLATRKDARLIAATIAAVDGSETVEPAHIAEATSFKYFHEPIE